MACTYLQYLSVFGPNRPVATGIVGWRQKLLTLNNWTLAYRFKDTY